jgi:phosphopantothenoylcysteine decarboxylase/phosphopantothenate--cysteine ligase
MGFAIAAAAAARGAQVTLVSGPVALATPDRVERVDVRSAREMREAVLARAAASDVFVAAAAVGDFRPESVSPRKIKKQGGAPLDLRLVQNPDILAEVAALAERPFVVGFAAETDDVERHAREKLQAKGADLIAANEVGAGRGFEADDNALLLLWQGGSERLERADKRVLAERLVERIVERMRARGATRA